ncbi:MAG: hypothetical protein U0Q55_17290 [Vicinamibacterales bacterium]
MSRLRLLPAACLLAACAAFSPSAAAAQDDVAAIESSGTSWTPRAGMPGSHRSVGSWTVMIHGDAYGLALKESGSVHHRGSGVASVNWFMGSATREAAGGRLTLRAMASAEPWTMRLCGYPDMLATGEVCEGDSIHDRQHPHDVLMELTASYDRPLTRRARLQVYGGPAGEAALGPTAFLHRVSAAGNPIAPIAHHWLDSSHVTFGVVTAAVYGRRWKVDGSVFNGREPDDRRRNVETGRWDAWSARATVAPSANVVLQVSGGHLPEAEAGLGTLPRQDVSRLTASASAVRGGPGGRVLAGTLAWGVVWGQVNTGYSVASQVSHAVLAEGSVDPQGPDHWFGRLEIAGKPAHDLHAEEFVPSVFTVGKVQLGYARALRTTGGVRVSAGATVSAGLLPPLLAPRYEGRVAPGAGVFIRIAPSGAATSHTTHDH